MASACRILRSKTRGVFSPGLECSANEIGLQANLGLAILLFTARATRGVLPRLILFASAVAAGMMAALTFSRSAFIGLSLILGYYLLSRRRIGSFLLAFLIILGAGLLLPDNPLVERATTGFEARDTDAITAGRVQHIWRPLLPTFWEAPIIGHGLGSTAWATPNRRGEMPPTGHPHNAYLGVLLDLGLVGIAVVGAFFWSVWKTFRRLSQHHVDSQWRGVFEGGIVALLCLAIQGVSEDSFTPTYAQAALWVCYGLALGHTQSMHSKQSCLARSRTLVPRSPLGAVRTRGSAGLPPSLQPDGPRRCAAAQLCKFQVPLGRVRLTPTQMYGTDRASQEASQDSAIGLR